MTSSRFHIPLAVVVLAAVLCVGIAAVDHAGAGAIRIERKGTQGLDGRVIVGPAAARIETISPKGTGDRVGPGRTVTRDITVANRTERTIDFLLEIAEVVGDDADTKVDVRSGSRGGAAAWVTIDEPTFTLGPGDQATVPVTIRIPRDVRPGSKPFAVRVTQGGGEPTSGTGIAPQFSQVVIFTVELPGDAPVEGRFTKAEIISRQLSADAGREGKPAPTDARFYLGPGWTDTHDLRVEAEYENTGERLLNPTGRVVVKDLFGRTVATAKVEPFSVYPGGAARATMELKGMPSLGVFTARIEIDSPGVGKSSTTLPRFALVPRWFALAAGVLSLWLLQRIVRAVLRRRTLGRYAELDGSSASFDEDWDGAPMDVDGWDDDVEEPATRS